MITEKALQTNAERQKAYRERKKQAKFFALCFPYQRLLYLSADLDNKDDILALIDECYLLAGEKLTIRFCCFINEFLSTRRSLPSPRPEDET